MKQFISHICATLCLVLLHWTGMSALDVTTTAGGQLSSRVTNTSITTLTVKGVMDARDFYFIADNLDQLTTVDLSDVQIVACETGEAHYGQIHFAASTLPIGALAGKRLTSVTLPTSLVAIDEGVFLGCRELPSITLPDGLTTIGNHAFAACAALTSVTLPVSVTTVGEGAFARCSSLTSFTAKGITQLASTALMDCPKLTQVSLGSKLRSVGERAMAGSGVKSLDVSGTQLDTLGNWTFVLTPLASISLPNAVTSMGQGAFLYDTQLTAITLPQTPRLGDYMLAGSGLANTLEVNNVDTLGAYVLYNANNIPSVVLSDVVKHLDDKAMAGMIGLETMTSNATTVPTLGEDVWDGVNQSVIPLTVPSNARDDYRAAAQWLEFLIADWLTGDVNGDGEVTIADVNAIIDIILGTTADPDTQARADVNGDGEVTIADVNAVVDIILSGGSYNLPVNTDDLLMIPDVSIDPGEEVTVKIILNNAHEYSALQCDITLPDGLEMAESDITTAERSQGHVNKSRGIGGSTTRTVLYSMKRELFEGNTGAVLTITLRATKAVADGSLITLTNVMLADNDNVNWHAADYSAQVAGSTGIVDATANDRVWASERTLHISTSQPGTALIANMSGMVREMPLETGDNERSMEPGIYIVKVNGKSHKVVVK